MNSEDKKNAIVGVAVAGVMTTILIGWLGAVCAAVAICAVVFSKGERSS